MKLLLYISRNDKYINLRTIFKTRFNIISDCIYIYNSTGRIVYYKKLHLHASLFQIQSSFSFTNNKRLPIVFTLAIYKYRLT